MDFVFVCLLRLVDGRMRAHGPNASFSGVRSTVCGRFSEGAAAPQTPRDDGLNLARPSAKISAVRSFVRRGHWT